MRGATTAAQPAVVVRLAGLFTVVCDGRPAAIGGKTRTLLELLAVRRDRTVPIDEIVAVLWDSRPPRCPADNVATLVSRLRRALGPRAVVGGRAGYRLGPVPAVTVDIDLADALVAAAEASLADGDMAAADRAAVQALELLGDGEILVEDPYADWVEHARVEAAGLVRRARHTAAAAALGCGAPERARGPAEAAIAVDQLDEVACRLLMRAQTALGEPALALRTYERLRHTLATELGAGPAAASQALHVEILRDLSTRVPRAAAMEPAPEEDELVGRAREVARLAAAWADATAGRPAAGGGGDDRRSGVLLVAGESGIGKSSLVRDLARTVAGAGGTVLAARCDETERSLFLQPFVDALRPSLTRSAGGLTGPQAAALAALVPEAAAVLGVSPSEVCVEPYPAGLERRLVYDAVAAFLHALAAREPVLLVLEDLHDAAPATVELVRHLCRPSVRAPVLVVATVRPEQGMHVLARLDGVAGRLDVGPLSRDAVARLAAAAGHGGSADRIYQATGGQTQFVVELLRGLAAGDTGVPEPVRSAVLARVRRTGAWTERLLREAAARGLAFRPAVVAELAGLSPRYAVTLWERALRAHLLVVAADGEYRFANPLIHQVLRATTSVARELLQ